MSEQADRLRLYSCWRGLVLALASPLVLLIIGALALSESGVRALPAILIVVGAALLAVSLFDYPLYTTFDETGITRRTPVRAHRIAWEQVDAINRARAGRRDKRAAPLTAAAGRRKYLLVDRCEGADEYEELRVFLTAHRTSTPLIATAPKPDTAPTWLYHRKG